MQDRTCGSPSTGSTPAPPATLPTELGSYASGGPLPTDEQVDHALGAYGPGAALGPRDWRGHIPDAPGQHGAERGHAVDAAQIRQQRDDLGDQWKPTDPTVDRRGGRDLYNAHHADAAFGDGDGGNAA